MCATANPRSCRAVLPGAEKGTITVRLHARSGGADYFGLSHVPSDLLEGADMAPKSPKVRFPSLDAMHD